MLSAIHLKLNIFVLNTVLNERVLLQTVVKCDLAFNTQEQTDILTT
jgi:hypothetical protein